MSYRVGLVTYDPASPGVHPDPEIDQLVCALVDAGLDADAPAWSIPRMWAAYDLLILKSPWDYSMRAAEFMAWLDATETQVPVLNSSWLIRWNIDKRYLRELAADGIPTPAFTTPASVAEARSDLGRMDAANVVVKPTVSAGSRNTGLFARGDQAALDLVQRILEAGKVPMLMRALPDVAANGERSLVVFNGVASHAARKGPILATGGGYLGGSYTEVIRPAIPLPDEVEVAERCIDLVRRRAVREGVDERTAMPLYARIDIVRDEDHCPTVLELELFEPNYFTATVPAGVGAFVSAVVASLERLGTQPVRPGSSA